MLRLTLFAGLCLLIRVQARCSGSLTINSPSDVDTISNCQTFNGDITISPSASGAVDLGGLSKLEGGLEAANATQLTSITADNLTTIQGTFHLADLTILTSLQFGALSAVNKIQWGRLPALQNLNFDTGVTKANNIYITKTQLNDLGGIDVSEIGSLYLSENAYLSTITLDKLTNVTQGLAVRANGQDLEVSLSDLDTCANMSMHDVAVLKTPSLRVVAGGLAITTGSMNTLSFPKLASIANTFTVVDCSSLAQINASSLQQVYGDLQIVNNADLTDITFPALNTVNGDLQFKGAFDSVTLPDLITVQASVDIETSASNDTLCKSFRNTHMNDVQGQITCYTGSSDTTASGGSATSSSSGSSGSSGSTDLQSPSSPSSHGSAIGALIGIIIGGLVVIAVCAWALWTFLKRSRARKAKLGEDSHPHDPELSSGRHHEKTELPANSKYASELQGSQERARRQYEAKELSSVSTRSRTNSSTRQTTGGATNRSAQQPSQVSNAPTISNPSELSWDHYGSELQGSDVPDFRTDCSSRLVESNSATHDPDATSHLIAGNIGPQPSARSSSRTAASKPLTSIQEKILSQLKERRKSVKRRERELPSQTAIDVPPEDGSAGPSGEQSRRTVDEKAPGRNWRRSLPLPGRGRRESL